MLKKYPIVKWTLLVLTSLIILLVGFGWWFMNLIPKRTPGITTTQVTDLAYVSEDIQSYKGKILIIVTSTGTMGNSGKNTGYELTELSRAYYVFEANGFKVDIASPKGGEPPVVIDDEDMGSYDFAFLNDNKAQRKVKNSIPVSKINSNDYEAVFFTGGKGAMFDFPKNKDIQRIIKNLYESNKVIGAVCHGPAALVNVTLSDNSLLVKGKNISGFTNKEELLLISDAETIFPFLLQEKLVENGAKFDEGYLYLEQVSHDENLITGQNPWSTWLVAETVVEQLGCTPKYREKTPEENAVKILNTFNREGKQEAKKMIDEICIVQNKPVARILIAKHSIMAIMQGNFGDFYNLLALTSYAKKKDDQIRRN